MNFAKAFIATALAIIITASTAVPSFAKTFNGKVKSGKASELVRFSLFDPRDCGAGIYPQSKITQPSHGTITVKKFRGKLSVKGHCNGKVAKGIAVYYKSKRGYRGPDKGKVNFHFPRGADGTGFTNVKKLKFKIGVK